MARPLRIQFAGAVYHVTSRGNARKAIYRDDGDRGTFLATLEHVVSRYEWRCHAYCLMGNHYHLLVETPKPNLARGMRQLNGLYAQRFNGRYGRVGHVFASRYGAVLVERDAHLVELCRYVVLNPVRAGLCAAPEEWPWSSYRATAGLHRTPAFLEIDWLLSQFAAERSTAQRAYCKFVGEGLGRNPWEELAGRTYLGSLTFVREKSRLARPSPEVARIERQPLRPALGRLFADHGGGAIGVAAFRYGYRLREIAEFLGVHYSTVSRRLREFEPARHKLA